MPGVTTEVMAETFPETAEAADVKSFDSEEFDEEVGLPEPEGKNIDDEDVEEEEDGGKGGCFNKGKKKKHEPKAPKVSFIKLFKYATGFEKVLIALAIFSAAGHGTLFPVFTILFGDILQEFGDASTPLDPTEALEAIKDKSLIFVYLGIAALVSGFFQVFLMMWSSQKQARRIRNLYMRALLSQEMAWYDEVDSSELAQRVSADVQKVEDGIGDKVSTGVQFYVMFLTGFIIGFVYGWRMTLVILALTPLLAASGYLFAKMSADAVTEGQTAYAKAGAVAHESFSMIKIVAAYGLERTEIARYGAALKFAVKSGIRKSFFMGLGLGLTMFVIISSYGLAFWYGHKLVTEEIMEPGNVVTVFFAVILGAMALGQGAPAVNAINEASGAAPKVFEVIARESKINSFSTFGMCANSLEGNIEIKDVTFTYLARPDRNVLNGLNMTIEKGTTVALVGESGCGKSTTIQLLERFYDPQSGSVTLDGVDLAEYNVQWLRGQMGFVQQMPTLFAMSIKENIALGAKIDVDEDANGNRVVRRSKCSDTDIIEAAKLANAHDFISKLPQGYDTEIGDRGAQLSGGQKQRIAIARALVRDPKILLLDEATSALDTNSERIVQEAIEKAQEGRTVVVIAHRLSTIRNADKIVVFQEGVVHEQGTHEELMANEHGIYTNLVKLQTISAEQDAEEVVGEGGLKAKSLTQHTTQKSELDAKQTSTKDEKEEGSEEDESELKVVDKGVISRALKLNKPEWFYFIAGSFGASMAGLVWPVFSIIFSEILVALVGNSSRETIRMWALTFFGIGCAAFIGNWLQIFLFGTTGEILTNRLREACFESLIRQDIGFFDLRANSVGILTARLGTEASKIKGATGERLGNMVNIASIMIAAIIIAFISCWRLAFVVLATVPLFALGGMVQMRMMAGFSGELGKTFASANHIATTSVDCIQTVTALGVGEKFLEDYDRELEAPAKAGRRKAVINGLAFGFTEFAMFAIWGLAFWYGSILIDRRQCEFDGMMKALTALLFGAMMLGQVAALMPDAAEAGVAATKVFRLIDAVSSIDPFDESGDKMETCDGVVSLDNVVFRYPARPEQTVLKGLNVTAEKGKVLALVGPSGSGKSTVTLLTERFYDVHGGKVSIDGKPIDSLNIASLREHIGFVTQEPELFSTTIRGNITHGFSKKEGTVVTEAQIIEAAKLANAHKFIMKLPKGYDTEVGAHGGQLSGGQRQRIAIARAVVRDPKILLLDEATSALDSESEKIVQAALDKASAGRTTIVIAHRLSTIRNADLIAVVADGKIRERGTHRELTSIKDGIYAGLVLQQQLE